MTRTAVRDALLRTLRETPGCGKHVGAIWHCDICSAQAIEIIADALGPRIVDAARMESGAMAEDGWWYGGWPEMRSEVLR